MEPAEVVQPSRWRSIWDADVTWSFRHSPVAVVAAVVTLAMILSAIFAPWIATTNPFDPASLNLMNGFS
ncbi:MAG: ABC transporter permease, partial [Jannaschia helgolandensis]